MAFLKGPSCWCSGWRQAVASATPANSCWSGYHIVFSCLVGQGGGQDPKRITLNGAKHSRQLPCVNGPQRHSTVSFILGSHARFHLTCVLESLKISNPPVPCEFTPKFTCTRGGCITKTSFLVCTQ